MQDNHAYQSSRLFVDFRIKKLLIKKLLKKLNSFKSFKNIYGLISTQKQLNTIRKILYENKKFKSKLIFGSLDLPLKNFIKPIVFCDLPEKNIINKKELFGPILSINSFKKIDEAIEKSNSTNYGLSAVVCVKKKKNINIASKALLLEEFG